MASFVVMICKEVLKAVILALLSEGFIKELLVYFLKWLAQKTTNTVDDELVAMVERALDRPVDASRAPEVLKPTEPQ